MNDWPGPFVHHNPGPPPEVAVEAPRPLVLTLVGATYATYLLPDSLLRLLFWLLTHTLYRVRVEGRDNLPERGGALCVCSVRIVDPDTFAPRPVDAGRGARS